MNGLRRAWRGEEKLWKVFWVYGPLVRLAIIAFDAVALFIARVILPEWWHWLTDALFFGWYLIIVWRCSFNVSKPFWGYIARIVAIGGTVLYLALNVWLSIMVTDDMTLTTEEWRSEMDKLDESQEELERFKEQMGGDQ